MCDSYIFQFRFKIQSFLTVYLLMLTVCIPISAKVVEAISSSKSKTAAIVLQLDRK